MISKEQISQDLQSLGVRRGDAVMMHSSLSAIGQVEGGAEAALDGVLGAIGPEGTLIAPAFRDSVWGDPADFAIADCRPCPQRFCPSRQRGFQGAIPEALRLRPGCLRSCHPTHSWVGLGLRAGELLEGHRLSPTPCGPGNSFEKLVELGGCILLLGVQVNTVTLWHYYEEILQVPYMGHYWPKERHLNHCVPARRIQYEYPGIMQEVCKAAGILRTGPVGKGTSGLMRAGDFDSFMATILADDPWCLALRPPDRQSGDLAIDALRKAEAMLRAWTHGPRQPERKFGFPPAPVCPPGDGDVVRRDCPAFAGMHDAGGGLVPLCRANGRHPDFFRLGGLFNECGITTCERCVWNEKYPPER